MPLSERMYACASGMTDALSVERWRHWVIKNDGWKHHTALSSPSLFAHLTDCRSSEPNTHRCRGWISCCYRPQGKVTLPSPLSPSLVSAQIIARYTILHISPFSGICLPKTHTNTRLKHMYTQGRKTLRHKLSLMSISFMTNGLKSISRILCSFTHPFSSVWPFSQAAQSFWQSNPNLACIKAA